MTVAPAPEGSGGEDRETDEGRTLHKGRPAYPTHREGGDGPVGPLPPSIAERPEGGGDGEPEGRSGPVEDPLEEIAGPGSEGRYQREGEIGHGGMGAIFRIFDHDIRRPVAMKVVLEDGDSERVERFIKEARVTGQLEHPNIVPVYEIGVGADRKAYFTMKLVRGESLQEIIFRLEDRDLETRQKYSLPRRLQIFLKVCDAVAFAHSKGVIHRDLKPENVMVGAFGEVLLMDWGLAKVLRKGEDLREIANPKSQIPTEGGTMRRVGARRAVPLQEDALSAPSNTAGRTLEGDVMGSPSFMPPEQAAGKVDRIDERSDVWSLGAILYGMLCFEAPHRGEDVLQVLNKAVICEVVPPSRRAPWADIPREIEAVCMKAMARNKEDRYPSAEALVEDVQAFLDRRLVSAYRYGIGERISRWVQRHPASSVGVGVASVLLAFGATVTVFLLQQAEIARMEARQAEQAKMKAEAQAETAMTLLEKSRRVSSVMRGAKLELASVHEALVRSHRSLHPIEDKRRFGETLWPKVVAFEKNLREDTATRAAWLALKGWLRRLAGHPEEGMELFRRSRETDPDVAYGSLFEGMHWLSFYIARQPLPMTVISVMGIEFLEAEGETADMAEARERFETSLESVREAGVWGEASAEEFASVLEGFQGMQKGDFEAAERGLSRALNVPEMAFLTVDLLFARAKVRHRLLKFRAGIEDLEIVKKTCPDDPSVPFFMGELWQGEALLAQLRNEDPRPLLERAIADHTASIELGMPIHYPFNARGSALLIQAAYESRSGLDARPALRRAVADFTEAIRMSGPLPNLLANRGSALRNLALEEDVRGRDPRPFLERAEQDLVESVRATPGLWFARNTLAKVYGLMGEVVKKNPAQARPYLDKAVAHLDVLRDIAPERSEPREVESQVLRVLGDVQELAGEDPRPAYRRAADAIRFVLERGEGGAMAHVNLGAALANLGQAEYRRGAPGLETYEQALAAFDEAIRNDPRLTRAYMNKILVLRRLARFEEASETLRAMKEKGREAANMKNIETSLQVIEFARTAPPWMAAMLEAHQLYNGADFRGAGVRYEKAMALTAGVDMKKDGTNANLMGIAHLRVAIIAALASEGKMGPLAPAAPVQAEEAVQRRQKALEHLRGAMEHWPPLLDEVRKNSALACMENLPAFKALIAEWEGKGD